MTAGGAVHVLDDAGPLHTLDTPAGCRLAAVGDGRVLFDCSADGLIKALVVDAASGAATPLVAYAEDELRIAGGVHAYDAIGAQWARLRADGPDWHTLVYVPLVGVEPYGETRGEAEARPASRIVADLDRPALARHLCEPLRVPAVSVADSQIAAFRAGTLLIDRFHGYAPLRHTLTLQRCGARPHVVSACPHDCAHTTLGTRAVAWIERDRRIVIQSTRSSARRGWRPRSGATALVLTGTQAVARTRDGAIITRPLP
jgi:hypothetical protein